MQTQFQKMSSFFGILQRLFYKHLFGVAGAVLQTASSLIILFSNLWFVEISLRRRHTLSVADGV